MDYTIEELEEFIRDAADRGKPDLVKYYQGQIERLRADQRASK